VLIFNFFIPYFSRHFLVFSFSFNSLVLLLGKGVDGNKIWRRRRGAVGRTLIAKKGKKKKGMKFIAQGDSKLRQK